MRLLSLLPTLQEYVRIKRPGWDFFLVKSEYTQRPLIKINSYMLQMEEYRLTYEDLMADDWEIIA